MDSQFTTLTRSYHDNYLQYVLTGSSAYQTAYESAKEGLDTIIASMQSEVDSQDETISNFYHSGIQHKLSELKTDTKNAKRNLVSSHDELVSAQMRKVPQTINLSANYTSYYVTAGALMLAAIVLNML
jgi:paraquat-inducible protein B